MTKPPAMPEPLGWYVVNNIGMATLCADEAEAQLLAEDCDMVCPRQAPHRAVQLVDLAALQSAQLAAAEFNGWYCAHCQRGVDASEVTFHEQHTVCGRVITNDAPPAPQLAAAVSDEELLTAYNSIDPCNESPTDRLIRRLRAILALRPQAVPMTPEQVRALVVECGYDHASTQERADFINGVRTGERWHRITAQGAQGGEG